MIGKGGKQPEQMLPLHCDAPGRGCEAAPRDMQKDRAATPLSTAFKIVIQHSDDVVEMVLAPEPFMACPVRQGDEAIVIAVGRVIAPSETGTQRIKRQAGLGAPEPVRSIEHGEKCPSAARRRAIAFALG